MKVQQLLEAAGRSLAGDLLEDMMAEGPVMYASIQDGRLRFNEIYQLHRHENRFAPSAPKAGKIYSTFSFRAPGYYSWHEDPAKRGVGNGWGDGSVPFADEEDDDDLMFLHGRVFVARPPMNVVYTYEKLEGAIKQHFKQQNAALGIKEDLKESAVDTALKNKAEKTGVPLRTLRAVYNRGLAAWRTGHRPGVSQHQWAMGRVNSFLVGGPARKADADLWKKRKKS